MHTKSLQFFFKNINDFYFVSAGNKTKTKYSIYIEKPKPKIHL